LQVQIGSIVIDCNEFDKMLAFWQDILHYVLSIHRRTDG